MFPNPEEQTPNFLRSKGMKKLPFLPIAFDADSANTAQILPIALS
jgi:hypothetical protein